MKNNILAYICTRGRYETTLPMAMMSIAMQTRVPNRFILYDDNLESERKDLREIEIYRYIFQIFDIKGIKWEVIFGEGKGQHYGHQLIQKMAKDLCFRGDDDCFFEYDVLEKLEAQMKEDVGAVGGSILTPPVMEKPKEASSKIDDIYSPNEQWFPIKETKEVDHLHCGFLYRAGVVDYDLRLSKVAHREETMFTYSLKLAGYKNYITPCVTWHLRSSQGGIREGNKELYEHDDKIFFDWLGFKKEGQKLIILDNGLGDHYIFKKVLPKIKAKYPKLTLAVCYPEVFEDEDVGIISIAEGQKFEDKDLHNIYQWMDSMNWKKTLEEAFERRFL